MLRVRDIGGHRLPDGRWFRRGLVFRISGGILGPEDLRQLDSIGLRTLVDLRGGEEDRATLVDWAGTRGVTYRHHPIVLGAPADFAAVLKEHGVTEEGGLALLRSIYRRIIDDYGPTLAGAIEAIAEAQPAGFGCAAGKDRTGLLAALLQDLLGVDRKAILAGYVELAPEPERLREALSTWSQFADGELEQPGLIAMLRAVEEILSDTLDYVDEHHGGARRYLESAGLPAQTITALRERLISDLPA